MVSWIIGLPPPLNAAAWRWSPPARGRSLLNQVPRMWNADFSWGKAMVSRLPSGQHTKSYGKSPFLMGKSTITRLCYWLLSGNLLQSYWKWKLLIYLSKMVVFYSYVSLPEGEIFLQSSDSTHLGIEHNYSGWLPNPPPVDRLFNSLLIGFQPSFGYAGCLPPTVWKPYETVARLCPFSSMITCGKTCRSYVTNHHRLTIKHP